MIQRVNGLWINALSLPSLRSARLPSLLQRQIKLALSQPFISPPRITDRRVVRFHRFTLRRHGAPRARQYRLHFGVDWNPASDSEAGGMYFGWGGHRGGRL